MQIIINLTLDSPATLAQILSLITLILTERRSRDA